MIRAFEAIVAGSHLRYDGVWQRPQQILSRLAARVPVLFVEEPFTGERDCNEFLEDGSLTVLRPLRRKPDYTVVDSLTLDAVRSWAAGRVCLSWLYTPLMLPLAQLSRGGLVYDCMDELAAFRFAAPDLHEREQVLLAQADRVFAGGRSLYERRRHLGAKVQLVPSGVDFAFFASARRCEPHRLFAQLPGPVLGYFGVIDERIDYTILDELARRELHTVMIGPFAKIDLHVLPRSAYLHFTGQMPYALLPAFLAGFDVAIMPFARSAATRFLSPTKTPEYLAGGKPVVSTPIADVAAAFGDVVSFADTPAAFAATAVRVTSHEDAERRERGFALARSVGWDGLVRDMWQELTLGVAEARDAAAQ